MYRTLGAPLVTKVLQGVSASLIAYGQTGAGKTYSLFGPVAGDNILDGRRVTREDPSALGLITRAAHDLFERINTVHTTCVRSAWVGSVWAATQAQYPAEACVGCCGVVVLWYCCHPSFNPFTYMCHSPTHSLTSPCVYTRFT